MQRRNNKTRQGGMVFTGSRRRRPSDLAASEHQQQQQQQQQQQSSSSSSSSSGSTITRNNAPKENKKKRKRPKNPPPIDDSRTNVDIDKILSKMGLQTVPQSNTKKDTKKSTTGTMTTSSRIEFPAIDMKTQLDYSRNGHAVLRGFVPSSSIDLSAVRRTLMDVARKEELKAWKQKVQVMSSSSAPDGKKNDKDLAERCHTIADCQRALESLGLTASLPFLQYFNTWRTVPAVKELAFALGEAASILLDVPTVRLYQDSVFWKRRNDGPTPWHVDARMAPFDTPHMITFWIPLEYVPPRRKGPGGGTALIFCSKSHADFALPYWNPVPSQNNTDDRNDSEWDRLEDRYPKNYVDYMPMNVGDVTVHSGWTLHCSNGNGDCINDHDAITGMNSTRERVALAITFVDGDATIRSDWQECGDDEDRWSYEKWCQEVKPRTKITHDLVPIVWPPTTPSS
jgi:ectoine hydroxylase-related dioxygenase (phytanoyl-CoA dioxygenase family)